AQYGIAANHIKGERLGCEAWRGSQRHNTANAFGMTQSPGDCLMATQRASHDRSPFRQIQMLQQPPLHFNHVSYRHGWEIPAVRLPRERIGTAWTGSAPAPAQQIRANDKELVGINGFSGTYQYIPPPRVVLGVMAGYMRIAADRMANQHCIIPRRIQ